MKTKEEYIQIIRSHADEIKASYGVKTLRLFGSVSRGDNHAESDVDICVDMEPKAYTLVALKRFLTNLLQCSVDIVRIHKHINPYLLSEIEKDGIYVIR